MEKRRRVDVDPTGRLSPPLEKPYWELALLDGLKKRKTRFLPLRIGFDPLGEQFGFPRPSSAWRTQDEAVPGTSGSRVGRFQNFLGPVGPDENLFAG